MNLNDYAYENDGAWYLNPQVSLDEQNAFINNLRNMQAAENAQIRQQTYGLGTQVPSQLGGLVGGGGYFAARQQTPQLNQTIAELRTAAQAQALNTALQNELAKAQAAYKKKSTNVNNTNTQQKPLIDKKYTDASDLFDTELIDTEEVPLGDKPFNWGEAAKWGLLAGGGALLVNPLLAPIAGGIGFFTGGNKRIGS